MLHVWSFFGAGVSVGIFGTIFLVIIGNILDEHRACRLAREAFAQAAPEGYVRCKNFARCGWWFRACEDLDECNHCYIGPDWRAP